MNFLNFIALVVIFHMLICLFDNALRKFSSINYIRYIKRKGFEIKFLRIQWYSTSFNENIGRLSRNYSKYLNYSYFVGVIATILLFPVAIYFILSSIFNLSRNGSDDILTTSSQAGSLQHVNYDAESSSPGQLEILLPGVNLPLSDVGFYVISLLICSVIHELGHGMAACVADVPITGFGIFVALIIPIAFTEIDTTSMNQTKFMNKMKIMSAGIWHNLVLTAVAYSILLILPFILSPFYLTNDGVFVTNLVKDSIIQGDSVRNGIFKGDRIIEINGCKVASSSDYENCMRSLMKTNPAYCVPKIVTSQYDIIKSDADDSSCCGTNDDPSYNCFEFTRQQDRRCMKIRQIVEHAKIYCHISELPCPSDSDCIRPVINGSSTIIHMKRENRQNDFIYFGPVSDILRNIEVTDFIPRTKMFSPSIGESISLLLKYIIVFSSGLAIVNTFPCFGLDGHLIIRAAISHIDNDIFTKEKKELTILAVNLLGSITFMIAILKIILNMIS